MRPRTFQGPHAEAGKELRERREKATQTQQALAFACEVSQPALSGWERGVSRPPLVAALRLHRQIGMAPTRWGYTQEEVDGLLRSLRPPRARKAVA